MSDSPTKAQSNQSLIDPLVSLAFSLYTNKGVYALLIGSGVSTAAGIPTGWDIMSDLINKVALLSGEQAGSDPAAWYSKKFKREANYSVLLDALTHSSSERRQLLSGYIEPSQQTKEPRIPTPAHIAIARLVRSGYVRVLITTNFDRLIEQALAAVGITPTVLSSADALRGAIPLQHSPCTIIKVHGDYLDTRIKNSISELSRYDPAINKLLDQVFDEFGLLVVGWSAEWDIALRSALERCKSRRYGMYWATRNTAHNNAKQLIEHRRAETITIKDANQFFVDLEQKILSLEQLEGPHPLSRKLAIATTKRFLSDDRHKIELNDLVTHEVEKAYAIVTSQEFSVQTGYDKDSFPKRIAQYDAAIETLQSVLVTGAYWDGGRYADYWLNAVRRFARIPMNLAGLVPLINVRQYPTLALGYAGGLAAIARGNYALLNSLLTGITVDHDGEEKPLILRVSVWQPIVQDAGRWLPGMDKHYTPLSDHLYSKLRPQFKDTVPDDGDFEFLFDRLEYLWALLYVFTATKTSEYYGGAPLGRFWWRNRSYGSNARTILKDVENELAKANMNWPILKAGLFDGTVENFNAAKKSVDEVLAKAHLF